ncbi:M61 family metallopeptidase [Pontibacter flavimaris]|uniref:Peptidase M61 n=1 Tax=Pontibacter flavimaris TaxID=1797110 RepID=A0A1Q5PDY5_9BACT|nr:PDZ domain-containing protein [Pontibacter flavimaris]OKL40450.1 peptidase M61 [Pontibacter flavimaris]
MKQESPLLLPFGKSLFAFLCLVFLIAPMAAHSQKSKMKYTVSMDTPSSQAFQVRLEYSGATKDSVDFKLPVWTPGYYQILDYADNLEKFRATGKRGKPLKWKKTSKNAWRVYNPSHAAITLTYDIKATTHFVAKNYLDETRGYISPAGMFLHIAGKLDHPVTLTVKPYKEWQDVATGLNTIPGKEHQYVAANFDILYDSPLLIGNLERLPEFYVEGIPHRFVGYQLGEFDRKQFMEDLKKVVETASNLIGHIPYDHYTFIAIGPGRGGIEHLNSTTISFSGAAYNNPQSRLGMLDFLAHEYFHHYNAKRIRPIELGPFNYDRENKTNMLWVAEGATSYYQYLILQRAGLMSSTEMIDALRSHLTSYENKPGRLFQSATQASYNTWSDGPFGRTEDEFNKTVSVYDKGPILNMLLDFKIRHASGNARSLDDVMRFLYNEYYLKQGRGYTEAEYWEVCERMAGTPLEELAAYTATVKPIDYKKYFAYAGLDIDTATTEVPGAYTGIVTKQTGDTLLITDIDYKSPAWEAGLRRKQHIAAVNGLKATDQEVPKLMSQLKPGDTVQLLIADKGEKRLVQLTAGTKKVKNYNISPVPDPTPLQHKILSTWLGEQVN